VFEAEPSYRSNGKGCRGGEFILHARAASGHCRRPWRHHGCLSGSEIGELLATCQMVDIDSAITKRHRLYNAFAHDQNTRQARTHVLAFIRKAMRPERFLRCPERFEPMRALVNGAIAFAGLAIDASGVITPVEQARTLSEAQRRGSGASC
jgi:hypothetical protein